MYFFAVSAAVSRNSWSALLQDFCASSLANWLCLVRKRLSPYCASAFWRSSIALLHKRTLCPMLSWSSSDIWVIHVGRSRSYSTNKRLHNPRLAGILTIIDRCTASLEESRSEWQFKISLVDLGLDSIVIMDARGYGSSSVRGNVSACNEGAFM